MNITKEYIIEHLNLINEGYDIVTLNSVSKKLTPFRSMLDKMIEEQSWICPIEEGDDDWSYYSIGQDKIVIPKKEIFGEMWKDNYYSILFHEMCHSLGREDRFNRFHGNFGSEEYAYEEFVCEIVSSILCNRYFVVKRIKVDSRPYINMWIKNLENGNYKMTRLYKDVVKACREIIKIIEGNTPDSIFS